MLKLPSFEDLFDLHADTCLMLAEAQAVAAFRLLGFGGLWPLARSEVSDMVVEKAPAFAEAGHAAMAAAFGGGGPVEVAAAWLQPIRKRTSANMLRLSAAAG